jgi:hypothetical protein
MQCASAIILLGKCLSTACFVVLHSFVASRFLLSYIPVY